MRTLVSTILAALAASVLIACGGGAPSLPIPEAQASAPDTGCPTGDATKQLQGMIDKAEGDFRPPPCPFYVSETIVIRKPLFVSGAGATVKGTRIISSAKVGVLVEPDITISVADCGPSCRGWWATFENFRIEPAKVGQGGPGGHAMVLRIAPGRFISTTTIDRVYFGDFGGQGLVFDNSAGNKDGFFTTTVRRSWIENGVKGVLVGDSITFEDNVLPDGVSLRPVGGFPCFDLTTVPGSRQVHINRNSCTTSGGGVVIRNASQVTITNNWFEHPSVYGSPYKGGPGLLHLINVSGSTITNNTTNLGNSNAKYALLIEGGADNYVGPMNDWSLGSEGHIGLTGGTAGNAIDPNQRCRETAGYTRNCRVTGADTGLITPPKGTP